MPVLGAEAIVVKRPITRRDFLNGVAVGVGGALVPDALANVDPHLTRADYPPARTGLRGSHPGSFEAAHALRDGLRVTEGRDTGEHYDLIVVGAGISGLSSAYFYREAVGERARVLVLDNHDDFGGHAKRNEFSSAGRQMLGYGGTMLIDTPAGYPPVAKNLLDALGIDIARFETTHHRDLFDRLGLSRATFLNAERYGTDFLAVGDLRDPEVLSDAPLSAEGKAQLIRLYANDRHYLATENLDAQIAYLDSVSYETYLKDRVGIGSEAMSAIADIARGVWAIGIDALPAVTAWSSGYPGFGDLDLGLYPDQSAAPESTRYHFPDGNATIARLLVRDLVRGSAPGNTMEDIVLANFDYGALDRAANNVRIRLNSTAVDVRHLEGASTGPVRVTYLTRGQAQHVTADKVVLACYHGIIPYLCSELPAAQRKLLARSVRAPLVYTNVLIRDWKSFAELGFHRALCSGSFFHNVMLGWPASIGGYEYPANPEEPMVLHLNHVPGRYGLSAREQFREGQRALLRTPFETYEHHVRAQLSRMLTPGGFDADRDIEAITVNRWPHGYAYGYDPETDRVAFEPQLWPTSERYWERSRRPYGNIAIAGSDAASNAMTEAAIEQGHRAVMELSKG